MQKLIRWTKGVGKDTEANWSLHHFFMLSLGLFTGVAVLRLMKITRNYITSKENHANTAVIPIYCVKDEQSKVPNSVSENL